MRHALTILAASLACAACSLAGPTSPPVPIEPGRPFSLRVGQTGQTRDAGLRIGFEGVSADSRCPQGERCVWAGEAVLRVWLQQGSASRQLHELHSAPGAAPPLLVAGQELRVLRLDPYPVSGRTIAPGDYVATLQLSAAER